MRIWAEKIRRITVAVIRGISGIVTEMGYALAIMLAAFFICVLVTSFYAVR